jgi:hypothetical protein
VSTTDVDHQPAEPARDVDQPEQPTTTPEQDRRWTSFRLPNVRSRTLRRALLALAPCLTYLAVRELGLLVLGWLASANNTTMTRALTSWDGQWYLGIAAGGYDGVPAGLTDAFGRRTPATPLAFFPGYPTLVNWVAHLPGVDLVAAAFTVSLVCGVGAAYALARLGRRVGGRTAVGLILVVLFAASPMAIALSMAYSEALFCALAAWALVGVVERKWLLAGLCTLGTGLVRPTAAALVVTVAAAAIVTIVRRRDGVRPWLGLVLAPMGLLGYLGFVAQRTGSLTGWFTLQREGWNSTFDGGVATVRFGLDVLSSGRSVLEVVTIAVLVAAVALVVISVRQRLPWPLVLYGALVLVMDVCANGLMNSKARLLLPAFTLLLPIATGLAKRRPGTVLTVLAAIAVASAWFGAYALVGWQYAI